MNAYEILDKLSKIMGKPSPEQTECVGRIQDWIHVLMALDSDYEYENTVEADMCSIKMVLIPEYYTLIKNKGIRPYRLALMIIYIICEKNKIQFKFEKFKRIIQAKLDDPSLKIERKTIERDAEKFVKKCP